MIIPGVYRDSEKRACRVLHTALDIEANRTRRLVVFIDAENGELFACEEFKFSQMYTFAGASW